MGTEELFKEHQTTFFGGCICITDKKSQVITDRWRMTSENHVIIPLSHDQLNKHIFLFSFFPPEKYMMAVIVGTIGGVAVIAFIIAAVRYVGHNNKK